MRKFVLLALAMILFMGPLVYVFSSSSSRAVLNVLAVSTSQKVILLPKLKTYRHPEMGIEFNYPRILKVREEAEVITIEHSVPFEHDDPCDATGLPKYKKSKEILDFFVQITVLPLTSVELFNQEVVQKDDAGLVTGLRNTVRVTLGPLDGFRMYSGSHGCGLYSYFFQLSSARVLKVERWLAPEFQQRLGGREPAYRHLPRLILPEQELNFFREILFSFREMAK